MDASQVLGTYLYTVAFTGQNQGYASAIGTVIIFLGIILSYSPDNNQKRKNYISGLRRNQNEKIIFSFEIYIINLMGTNHIIPHILGNDKFL